MKLKKVSVLFELDRFESGANETGDTNEDLNNTIKTYRGRIKKVEETIDVHKSKYITFSLFPEEKISKAIDSLLDKPPHKSFIDWATNKEIPIGRYTIDGKTYHDIVLKKAYTNELTVELNGITDDSSNTLLIDGLFNFSELLDNLDINIDNSGGKTSSGDVKKYVNKLIGLGNYYIELHKEGRIKEKILRTKIDKNSILSTFNSSENIKNWLDLFGSELEFDVYMVDINRNLIILEFDDSFTNEKYNKGIVLSGVINPDGTLNEKKFNKELLKAIKSSVELMRKRQEGNIEKKERKENQIKKYIESIAISKVSIFRTLNKDGELNPEWFNLFDGEGVPFNVNIVDIDRNLIILEFDNPYLNKMFNKGIVLKGVINPDGTLNKKNFNKELLKKVIETNQEVSSIMSID